MSTILVLGATGMLGNAVFRSLTHHGNHQVIGTARSAKCLPFFEKKAASNILTGVDVNHHDLLVETFAQVRPQVVVNCVGLVKQLAEVNNPLSAVPINTLLPHRLAKLCQVAGSRLIHISTDCVFSGLQGHYVESDFPDAKDLYGRSKLLGEVDYPHAITLRTSIIGHELTGSRSLIGWFLSQEGAIKGFTRAIFSGLPTVELAHLIQAFVLPRPDLHGLYHVAAKPIDKCALLTLVAEVYGKKIDIVPDDTVAIDRSLSAQRFAQATGYVAPEWRSLIEKMHQFQ